MEVRDVRWRDLKRADVPSRSLEAFCFDALLKARVAVGCESRDERDHGANLYVVFLLADSVLGKFADCPVPVDLDVAKAASRTALRRTFELYRTNADALLVRIGIFDAPLRLASRGATYYGQAASYCHEAHRRRVPLVAVLERIAETYEAFVRILRHIGRHEFGAFGALSGRDRAAVARHFAAAEARTARARAYDDFIDRWSAWKRSGISEVPAELYQSANALHALDPVFPDARTLFPENVDPI